MGVDEARVAALAAVPPTRTADVRGGPLAHVRWDPAGAAGADDLPAGRRPVLLIHGHTGSKEDFALLGSLLAAAGHRVVAHDGRGQQESPGPDDPSAYSVDAFAADVVGLVEALGLAPVHLVGHSFGGLVARAAVLARPDVAASLTLLGSGPAALPDGVRRQALQALGPVLDDGGLAAVLAGVAALDAADPTYASTPVEWRDFLRRRWAAWNPVALGVSTRALLDADDRTDALRDLARGRGLPLLVAHGADDDAWSPALQRDMAGRLGARYEVVPGAAHSPAAEAPTSTADVLLDVFADAEQRPSNL